MLPQEKCVLGRGGWPPGPPMLRACHVFFSAGTFLPIFCCIFSINVNWSVHKKKNHIIYWKQCIYIVHIYESRSLQLEIHTQYWWQIAKICIQRNKKKTPLNMYLNTESCVCIHYKYLFCVFRLFSPLPHVDLNFLTRQWILHHFTDHRDNQPSVRCLIKLT